MKKLTHIVVLFFIELKKNTIMYKDVQIRKMLGFCGRECKEQCRSRIHLCNNCYVGRVEMCKTW
jgi:hypothetical protein